MALTTFIERICARNPFVVLHADRVYGVSPEAEPTTPDFVQAGAVKLGLVPSLDFQTFELLDQQHQTNEIEDYSIDFVRGAVQSELERTTEFSKGQRRLDEIEYVVFEFMPYLLSRHETSNETLLDEVLGNQNTEDDNDPVARARAEIAAHLQKRFGQAKSQTDLQEAVMLSAIDAQTNNLQTSPMFQCTYSPSTIGLGNVKMPDSITGHLTNHQPLCLQGNLVYLLHPKHRIDNGTIGVSISLYNASVQFQMDSKPHTETSRLSGRLLSEYKTRWNIDALNRAQQTFEQIRLQQHIAGKGHLETLAGQDEFDYKGVGFKVWDGAVYAYYTVPKFATQDSREPNDFYPFDQTRIAIRINQTKAGISTSGKACVIEHRPTHPCMHNRTTSYGWHHICILNRSENSYGNTTLELVRKLSDAVNVYRTPLSASGLKFHSGGTFFGVALNHIMTQGKMTRDQATRAGYDIVEVVETKIK